MRHLNLSFFNKILFLIISVFVQCIYHEKVMAYTTKYVSQEVCADSCKSSGYAYGLMGDSLIAVGIGNSGISSTVCYCLTSTEFEAAGNCVMQACSGLIPNSNGTLLYYLPGGTCNEITRCACPGGKWYSNSQGTYGSCVTCASGYYCPGGSSGGYSFTPGSSVICSSGYYCAGSGLSSPSACSGGTYQSQTGRTSCSGCSGYLGVSARTSPSTAATSAYNCYISTGHTFNDGTGDYKFVSDCYYR